MKLSRRAEGHGAMLLFSAMGAGSCSLGAMAANEIAPTALNAFRFLISALMLGVIVALAGPGLRRADFRAPWRYLLLGAIFAVYFVLMFEGLKTAPAVSASAVFTLTPLLTAGFGYVLLAQVLTPRLALGLSVGAAGALWVIFRGDPGALLAFEVGRGEMIYLAGCVAHALYTPLLLRLNRGEPALVVTFGVMTGGLIVLVLWGARDILATDWAALPLFVWVTLFYLAIFASAATAFLLMYATMRLPSAKVMAYTYLTPTWVILWEVALGNGVPPALILPGIGLSALALVLLLKEEARTMGGLTTPGGLPQQGEGGIAQGVPNDRRPAGPS
ncbi:MAG: DMT family transporter [Rhodobacteraceae bacterium]|nr:DMT family transporter [Paracoccaceae bacterium]